MSEVDNELLLFVTQTCGLTDHDAINYINILQISSIETFALLQDEDIKKQNNTNRIHVHALLEGLSKAKLIINTRKQLSLTTTTSTLTTMTTTTSNTIKKSTHHNNYNFIIIDPGSQTIKTGIVENNNIQNGATNNNNNFQSPPNIIPTIYGKPKNPPMYCSDQRDYYIGDDAISKRWFLGISYPIEYGMITHWDMMEHIWYHLFYNELRVDPEEHFIFIIEQPLTPKASREKLTQQMFETFNVQGITFCSHHRLSLLSAKECNDHNTGLVVETGARLIQIVPIVDGHVIPHAIVRCAIRGGDILVDRLMKLLCERGHEFRTSADRLICKDIFEKSAYVAQELEKETSNEYEYELPDGNMISIGNEQFLCTEPLFTPNLIELNSPGLVDDIYTSIYKSDVKLHPKLFSNIVFGGNLALLSGLKERVAKDLTKRAPAKQKINIFIAGKDSVYVGACLTIQNDVLNVLKALRVRSDYDEIGPSCVHQSEVFFGEIPSVDGEVDYEPW
jgi:actin-related protein